MAAPTVETGVYFIQNLGTGTVIDLQNGASADGTLIQGFQKRDLNDPWAPAQLWIIAETTTAGVYTIENTNSRTFLDLVGSSVANSSPIAGYAASGKPEQQWTITRNANNIAYVISNVATKTYIDLLDGGSTNGTQVNGWAGDGPSTTNPHQLWLIVRA